MKSFSYQASVVAKRDTLYLRSNNIEAAQILITGTYIFQGGFTACVEIRSRPPLCARFQKQYINYSLRWISQASSMRLSGAGYQM